MYKQLYKPEHHRSDITGMVPVHVLVAEKKLGRPLAKGELVHHKDFSKLNNEPDNLLFPMSRKDHQQLPEFQARFIIAKGLYNEFVEWWGQEKIRDKANVEIKTKERELVKLENEQERDKKRTR